MTTIKRKNVLITADAYDMLINEYKLKPSQLLAKMPVLEDRIKSPKSNRFIHIGSVSYMKLLSDYTEEELLLRRDGYILSPETEKLVKVFSKTFNALLEKHELETLLKLPRLKRGDVKVGVDFNQPIKTDKPKVKIVLEDEVIEKEINYTSKKCINNLIAKSVTPVTLFVSSTSYQTNADDKDEDEELKNCHAFHYASSTFSQGELVSYFESKEIRFVDDILLYNQYTQNPLAPKVSNLDDYLAFLATENENTLINIKVEEIDLLSMYNLLKNKEEIIRLLNNKYNQDKKQLFNIVKLHTWFICHAKLIQPVRFSRICEHLIIDEDSNYESFESVLKTKEKLCHEIDQYYTQILDFFQKI